jgi:hypothetical protein
MVPKHRWPGRVSITTGYLLYLIRHLVQNSSTDSDHHHGRGRITDPHGQERRNQHKSQYHSMRCHTNNTDRIQRNSMVEVPLFHGHGNEKPAQEKIYQVIRILHKILLQEYPW